MADYFAVPSAHAHGIVPSGVATRSFSDSNCLPNHKASVRIGEQLMIHTKACQCKEFMIGVAF
jgi:hypothetical protein